MTDVATTSTDVVRSEVGLDGVKLHFVDTFEDARNMWDWANSDVGADGPLGVDTETTGFKWHGADRARTVQVGDRRHGWVIPIDSWWGLFVDLMRNHRGPLDLMNAKFDYPFLRKRGFELDRSRIRDVGVMAHVNEPHMSRALKNQAKRHVDPRANALQHKLDEAMRANGWGWDTVPENYPVYWMYAGLDPVLTRHLSDFHLPTSLATAPKAYEVENAFQWVALDMETYGVHVDVPYAREYCDKFTAYCTEVERWCQAEYGIKPGSNAAVIKVLSEAGFEFSKATKSGAVSLDSEVLEGIDHPLARQVLLRRQLQKIASTYLSFYVEHADADGIIHPSINTLGARTGRMSMAEPNMQNLPVRGSNPGVKIARNSITARPGHVLLFCDFDQIEMRLLAGFSRDQGLINAFLDPEDFFVVIARNIFGDPTLVKSDPRRQPTKNSMYAKIYGAGLAKQAATAGVTIEQMKFVNQALNLNYPGIESFTQQVFQEALGRRNDGVGYAYATCPITGRRHPADRGKEYALMNYLIQGAAATIFKMKLLELHAAGLHSWMVAPVHDEIILDVPVEHVPAAVATLESIMNDATLLPVPITASVSWGFRWGEKREWTNESPKMLVSA